MVDTQVAPPRSPMGMVLKVIEERHEAGEPPFLHAIEVAKAMEDSGITAFDVGMSISRLVCERLLWFALDGIRLYDSGK